ncbi:MAG: hypothetical protein ACFE75_02615 [Candidatus Hodarchaeota archaeon]
MRPSRVFRLLFKIFVSLLILSLTIVSLLGGLSAIMILTNPGNIGVNPSEVEFNLEINNVTLEIDNVNFTLPFNLTNVGYFDLENLELKVDIAMNYSHINYPAPGLNETKEVQIFSNSTNFGTIPKGTTGNFAFIGTTFMMGNFPNFTLEVNWFRGPPAILFYANLTISLDYSIGLHSLTIGIYDLPVGGFP